MKNLLKILLISSLLSVSLHAIKYEIVKSDLLIQSIAYQINKNLPLKVNEVVTLNSVSGKDNSLYFKGVFSEENYDRTGMASKLIKDFNFDELNLLKSMFINRTQEMQLLQFCLNPRSKKLLDSGIDFKYTYYFETKKTLIGQTSITSNDCKIKND